jgi:PilZ domain
LTETNRHPETRVTFERGIKAHIMGIDGTWRRGCTMADVSVTGARLTVDESFADLNLKEFFLMLSSNGAVHRRCEMAWINGNEIGARFVTQTQSTKKEPKVAVADALSSQPVQPVPNLKIDLVEI